MKIMLKSTIKILLVFCSVFAFNLAQSQNIVSTSSNLIGQDNDYNDLQLNTITTAVPFLMIAPDARGGSMGDIGAATSPDANSIHWNASKLAFAEKSMGVSMAYTPWLRNLVPDISLSYLSFYKKISDRQAFGTSLRYFSLGNIQFTDQFGQQTRQFNPNEFAIDGAYALKLSERFSGGVALRYVYSNLTGGVNVVGADTKPGQSVAFDLSGYYENDDMSVGGKDLTTAFGFNFSNIGAKMAYSNTAKRDFIPHNMKLGSRATVDLDDYNSLTFSFDINKLLVPTPPVYKRDSNNAIVIGADGNYVIGAGGDPDRGTANGIFGSFSDAPGVILRDAAGNPIENPDGTYQVDPGSVFREEMREFTLGLGMEYWYDDQFAVRAGYFTEHVTKGNRKFFSIGAGLRYNVFALDFTYLIPAYFNSQNIVQNSPLQNTLRFTLTFDFDAFKAQNENEAVN
jgi:long-subunit fatty acid transport protein